MKNILVIDDNRHVLQLMCEMLGRYGYNVFPATDGVEGMKIYEKSIPDLVITDIVMPEKEGIEIITELRAREPKPKIIAISGGGRLGPEEYLPIALMLGADQVLEKPFLPKELIANVRELIG